jgi:hypothetical protein
MRCRKKRSSQLNLFPSDSSRYCRHVSIYRHEQDVSKHECAPNVLYICDTDLTHTSYTTHGTGTSSPAVALKNRARFPAIRTLHSSKSLFRSWVDPPTTVVRRDKGRCGDRNYTAVTSQQHELCIHHMHAYPVFSVGRALIARSMEDLVVVWSHEENQLDNGVIEFERQQHVNENIVALLCICADHSKSA